METRAARRAREQKAAKIANARTLAEYDTWDARKNALGLRALIACFLLPLFMWSCGGHGGLRFESAFINDTIVAATLLLPTIGMFFQGFLPPTPLRFGFTVVAAPVAAITFFVSLFLVSPLSGGLGGSETLVRSVRVGDAQVKAYRVDVFLDPSNVYVQRERTVLPGLVWVTPLDKQQPANAVALEPVDAIHVRCSYPPYLNNAKTRATRIVRCEGWF